MYTIDYMLNGLPVFELGHLLIRTMPVVKLPISNAEPENHTVNATFPLRLKMKPSVMHTTEVNPVRRSRFCAFIIVSPYCTGAIST